MPEEFEGQEISENNEIENEIPSEVEAKEEARVPVSVVKELRDELRQAKEAELLTRREMTNLMSEFQKMALGQANKANEMVQKLDPAVQAELEPYFAPLKNQIEEERKSRQALETELRTVKAKEYVYSNVPNFNELRPHIDKFIQSEYTADERADLTPKELVRIAKFVAKQQNISATSKGVARSVAKTESGSSASRPESSSPNQDATLKAWMEKNRDILS